MRFLSLAGPIVIPCTRGNHRLHCRRRALCAIWSLLCTPQPSEAQWNDGAVNASCFAVMMLLHLVWGAVLSIVDSIVSRRKRGKTRQLLIP